MFWEQENYQDRLLQGSIGIVWSGLLGQKMCRIPTLFKFYHDASDNLLLLWFVTSYLLCWTWCTRCSIFLFTLFLILFLFVLFHFSLKSKIIYYKNFGETRKILLTFCNIRNIPWKISTIFKSNDKMCWVIKILNYFLI